MLEGVDNGSDGGEGSRLGPAELALRVRRLERGQRPCRHLVAVALTVAGSHRGYSVGDAVTRRQSSVRKQEGLRLSL